MGKDTGDFWLVQPPLGSFIAPQRGEPRGEATRRVLAGYGRRGGARRPLVQPRALRNSPAQPGGDEGSVPPQSHGKGFRCSGPSVIHVSVWGKNSWKGTHFEK